MSYSCFIGGKLIETTGGNDICYAEESIVLNCLKPINICGDKNGVTLNKPKTYKPKTDLKITKVEGPFDDKDKLVKVVKRGLSYTYKATSSRKLEKGEEKLLKWATKNDDGKIKELGGVSSHNVLAKDGKILIGVIINEDCEKAKIYAYFKKASENISVLTDVELIEVLLIVGTEQHSQTYGNKLIFPAQAVREIKENYKNTKKVTVLIFTDGFNNLQLSTIEKDSKKMNSITNFKKINSVTSLVNYINNGDSVNTRDKVKIGIIKVFSHGLPSIFDFGLDGSNETSQRFKISDVIKLKVESFIKKPEIYSYACRTGNSDSRVIASVNAYEYDKNWVSIVKPEESLAQKLSDHINATVYAFLRRSNYTSTWLDSGDESYKSKYVTIEDEEVSSPLNVTDWYRKLRDSKWDDSLWNSNGGYAKPTTGETPGDLLPSSIFKFEKGEKPKSI